MAYKYLHEMLPVFKLEKERRVKIMYKKLVTCLEKCKKEDRF